MSDAPTLLNLENVPAFLCDAHLEDLAKAMAEGPEETIWAPHESEFIASHVEDVTGQLTRITQQIQEHMTRALLGEPIGDMAKAEGPEPWLGWDQERFDQVRAYLEARPTTRAVRRGQHFYL